MISLTGAELIIQLLEQQGVCVIAGIPGGANLPLYDALAKSHKIKHVLARHEQGAAFIAHGIARVSRKAAVCFGTSGPGATNLLTAIADAKMDSVPIVCITGQVPTTMIGTDAFQEVDTYGMSIPVTKHNYLVRCADELAEIIPMAFQIAESGRPGPVVIDVPKDVQRQIVTLAHMPGVKMRETAPDYSIEDIGRVTKLINESQKPVLCLGGGVRAAASGELATQLAETADIPTATTLMGLGMIPYDHPLSLGMLGMHGNRSTNLMIQECDLFIAAGMRFDDRATGQVEKFCSDAKIVHIDIDPSELHKIKNAHIGMVGDISEVLSSLLNHTIPMRRDQWTDRLHELRMSDKRKETADERLACPHQLILSVAELAGPDAIVSTDVGQHQMWVAQSYPFTSRNDFLTSGGLGTMGFGLPAAIGAAIHRPDRTVICFSGDGSLLMNIQELVTAVEVHANVKIILMDNGSLGMVRQQQTLFYQDRIFASDFHHSVDFIKIAEGFGMSSYSLSNSQDPQAVLKKAIRTPEPCLIHVPLDVRKQVLPIVPPGAANHEMIGGKCHA